MLTLFSPRDDEESVETLHWYSDLMGSAHRILCMTFAFNLDDLFLDVLLRNDETLRYAVFDKNLKTDVEDQIDQVQKHGDRRRARNSRTATWRISSEKA